MTAKFDEFIITDLLKKAADDAERTLTLIPFEQRGAVYVTFAGMFLTRAAKVLAHESKVDQQTAFLRLHKQLLISRMKLAERYGDAANNL